MFHNHPSGNLTPSKEDIEFTKMLKNAGQAQNIHLIEHIILTSEGYFSFANEGLL